jgi:hypothetical protein
MCNYNNETKSWGNWEDGAMLKEVTHKYTQIDGLGLLFGVEMNFAWKKVLSKFSYIGYDDKNNWFQYKDVESKDILCIEGVKMSYLATIGFPDYEIRIYYFSFTDPLNGFVFY